jgi:hypothetical protein
VPDDGDGSGNAGLRAFPPGQGYVVFLVHWCEERAESDFSAYR